jgi:hypothetical protein
MTLELGEILALFTVLVNLGGLVWGASKMDSATKNLGEITKKLDVIASDHERRISWIEGGKVERRAHI